jgi:hypothetical protein
MKLRLAVITLLSFSFVVPTSSINAATLVKCPTSVTTAVRVKTPITKQNAELIKYIDKKYKRTIREVLPTSRKLTGEWWVNGPHECYFTDKTVASGYEGFLQSAKDIGYQTAINLTKETLSGGYTVLVSYYKKNSQWVIVRSGSGP